WLRPKRQADPEFSCPRGDGKRQHSRDANDSDQQRDPCEHAKDQGIQAIWREHFCTDVFERGGVLHGFIGGHIPNNFCYWRYQRVRISVGVDEEMTAKKAAFRKVAVNGGGG